MNYHYHGMVVCYHKRDTLLIGDMRASVSVGHKGCLFFGGDDWALVDVRTRANRVKILLLVPVPMLVPMVCIGVGWAMLDRDKRVLRCTLLCVKPSVSITYGQERGEAPSSWYGMGVVWWGTSVERMPQNPHTYTAHDI